MAQKPQIVDLRKSFYPGDPQTIQRNLVSTNKEDGEEQTMPLIAYEGYNFLPTSYGYRSYFGISSNLAIAAMNSRVQEVLTYSILSTKIRFIALAEDGIWISSTDSGSWSHSVDLAITTEKLWTHCVIENILYMYRQGDSLVYKTNINAGELEILSFTPSFLTMAGQIGIFKAGTRLGFWDSDNSVSWSSNLDLTDFTPSLENLAGMAIFADVQGRIVTVKNHGEGFMIYGTKSIVGVSPKLDSNFLWDAKDVFSSVGLVHPFSAVNSYNESEHFAIVTNGIVRIGKFNGLAGKYDTEYIFPEIYDFLRETRKPIFLKLINQRYLNFELFEERYVIGRTSFQGITIDPTKTALRLADEYWDGDIEVLPEKVDGNTLRTIIDQWIADNYPDTDTSCVG